MNISPSCRTDDALVSAHAVVPKTRRLDLEMDENAYTYTRY